MYVCMYVYVQGESGEPVHPEILNLNPGLNLNLNLNLLNQFEKKGGEDEDEERRGPLAAQTMNTIKQ